jgi:hypothetical protein
MLKHVRTVIVGLGHLPWATQRAIATNFTPLAIGNYPLTPAEMLDHLGGFGSEMALVDGAKRPERIILCAPSSTDTDVLHTLVTHTKSKVRSGVQVSSTTFNGKVEIDGVSIETPKNNPQQTHTVVTCLDGRICPAIDKLATDRLGVDSLSLAVFRIAGVGLSKRAEEDAPHDHFVHALYKRIHEGHEERPGTRIIVATHDDCAGFPQGKKPAVRRKRVACVCGKHRFRKLYVSHFNNQGGVVEKPEVFV